MHFNFDRAKQLADKMRDSTKGYLLFASGGDVDRANRLSEQLDDPHSDATVVILATLCAWYDRGTRLGDE